MTTATEDRKFTVADFASSQDVRWCPGCGDYSVLAAVKKVLAEEGIPPEQYAFISGIGCSSRFPYYMNTYGMHSIHGRATAVATGFKIVRPDMQTWVITGDGDALSIGGNHTIHTIRRNVDLKILLFNNEIYGLTKGQYSPTSPQGKVTKSTPFGSIDDPLHPLSIALGANASFVARAVDMHPKHLMGVLRRAHHHKGTAFVEIYQNCNIFNDGAFSHAQDRKLRADNVVELVHGEPLVFGAKLDKGVVLDGQNLRVVTIGEDGFTKDDLLVHDEKADLSIHFRMARMRSPEFPDAIGVIRCVERPTYDGMVNAQIENVIAKRGRGDLQELITGRSTWDVAEVDEDE
ncbi:MAG: 2-oxoglutarate/2-oxoacid ferredoxin oxidoreductase subunit beta [Candidatus Sumerlaeota bacterium]|nr:2-oxoglutarate/2-oxoacid ferredoxin oxidoreductase subunit beta [Candidatus Sumerlaeota bacterium]